MFDRHLFHSQFRAHAADRTLRVLAREIGVSVSTVSRLMNGEMPDIDTFAALVEWMAVSPADFFVTKVAVRETKEERLLWIAYALYAAELPNDLSEAILTLIRVVQNKPK